MKEEGTAIQPLGRGVHRTVHDFEDGIAVTVERGPRSDEANAGPLTLKRTTQLRMATCGNLVPLGMGSELGTTCGVEWN